MSRAQKVLVCGDVKGNFKSVFSRVNSVNEKSGPFDFAFFVGDFFGDSLEKLEPYRNGTLTVAVPSYILGPTQEKHVPFYPDLSGCEICPNVTYLGRHGVLTSSGLRIAYISGRDGGTTKSDTTFTDTDAIALRDAARKLKVDNHFLGVDLLLSSEWPQGVTNLDDAPPQPPPGSKTLSWLACHLRPRYHFCGLANLFYERPPYANCPLPDDPSPLTPPSTRFIALSHFSPEKKTRWLYAAQLAPLTAPLPAPLPPTPPPTPCPHLHLAPRPPHAPSPQFFYDLAPRRPDDSAPHKRRKHPPPGDPDSCWFCLGSTSVAKHLVVSIADEAYLALAKGGLTPLHAMIVPISHTRSQTDLPPPARAEVSTYKSCLRRFLSSQHLVPVFFERNFKTSHMQLHVVPVPARLQPTLKDALLHAAAQRDLHLRPLPPNFRWTDLLHPGTPYFYVHLPPHDHFLCLCDRSFPINFAREFLASDRVLNLPHRVDWRACSGTQQEEEDLCLAFRNQFSAFDKVS